MALVSLSRMPSARYRNEARFLVKKMGRQCVTPVIAVASQGSELWHAVFILQLIIDLQKAMPEGSISKRTAAKRHSQIDQGLDFAEHFRAPI